MMKKFLQAVKRDPYIYTQDSPLNEEVNRHLQERERNLLKPFFPFL